MRSTALSFEGKLMIADRDRKLYKEPLAQLEWTLNNIRKAEKKTDVALSIRCGEKIPVTGGLDAYRLEIASTKLSISSKTSAGIYYALQTLRELILICGKNVPCCVIDDWPGLIRRGFMLDVSRGKIPRIQTLKNMVELLASWKMNEFQIYMENSFRFEKHPEPSAGFSPYSADDILELQRHCKLHHVRLIPCLNSLGHMEKTLSEKIYSSG